MTALLAAILVFFSPNGGCQDAVIKCLGKAKHTIRVQAYYLTSASIVDAMIAAKVRGVDVQVILDGKTAFGFDPENADARDFNSPQASRLSLANIPVYIDQVHAIAHNKIIIIDLTTVITGSYNFTDAAEHKNAENLAVIEDRHVALEYWANWIVHRNHSSL